MKNIGILTQPLHQNYGGLLQAYALQTTLKGLGYKPHIIDRNPKGENPTLVRKLASHTKTVVYKILGRKRNFTYYPPHKIKLVYAKNTDYFIKTYIQPKSEKIYTDKELINFIKQLNPYGLVVGSDQVWRPMYSPNLPTYFLDFAKDNSNIKKISYAASFGVSNWEFSKQEEEMASELIQLFNAVSVREDSGLELCSKYLNTEAVHVLDPTLLLKKEHYMELVQKENEPVSEGDLFTYVLDKTESKKNFIDIASKKLDLKVFEVMPKNKITRSAIKKDLNSCIYPAVTKWIRAFMDAKFVITDSFHGCVFSILFNKPFIAIGNKDRGLARFQSLLTMFGLENRLNSKDITEPIDWDSVNTKLNDWRTISMDFLKKNLYE